MTDLTNGFGEPDKDLPSVVHQMSATGFSNQALECVPVNGSLGKPLWNQNTKAGVGVIRNGVQHQPGSFVNRPGFQQVRKRFRQVNWAHPDGLLARTTGLLIQ
ncbi:hypothetical protein NQT62_04145 [Limnobacter humi]|uniref:Uncharacterized protein n=1 Tax=Limnobacter humi TaxID=1778671 RepID=A0ABT1WDN3_9BURK|nr:hypothetical protein [Limnobacter humi]MCQ8895633.1 hypothetical protein [Limnobacter humi]